MVRTQWHRRGERSGVPALTLLATLAALTASPATAPGAEPLPLGCRDTGIFSDLDARVRLALPPSIDRTRLAGLLDERHGVVVLYEGRRPVKVYPMVADGKVVAMGLARDLPARLRPADAAELLPLLDGRPARRLVPGQTAPPGDRDDDGIPDPLDVLVGAKKLVMNGAAYTRGYFTIGYPGGDVAREIGVCTDVVIRALRNAGIDLQVELQADIRQAPRAYPMVKRRDASIDHRRVRTLLPWFRRHLEAHGTDPRSTTDPFVPGDVVFLDTLSRPGPDHLGVIGDTLGESGLPLIINNWTDGTQDAEMDLLGWVPVTHRFRLPPTRPRSPR